MKILMRMKHKIVTVNQFTKAIRNLIFFMMMSGENLYFVFATPPRTVSSKMLAYHILKAFNYEMYLCSLLTYLVEVFKDFSKLFDYRTSLGL